MTKLPLSIKIPADLRTWLKSGTASMGQTARDILWKATLDDVVNAIVVRYNNPTNNPTDNVVTTVIVSQTTLDHVDGLAKRLGFSRDTLVRLLFESRRASPNKTLPFDETSQ